MKKLIVLFLMVSGTAWAGSNDAATAFATGFANALNRSMGGQPYQAPAPVQIEVVRPVIYPPVNMVVAAIREDGSEGGDFANYASCRRFVRNTFGFADCEVRVR